MNLHSMQTLLTNDRRRISWTLGITVTQGNGDMGGGGPIVSLGSQRKSM